jgi:hypothetical protein
MTVAFPAHVRELLVNMGSGARFCRQYDRDCRANPLESNRGGRGGCLGFFEHFFSLVKHYLKKKIQGRKHKSFACFFLIKYYLVWKEAQREVRQH